MKKYLKKIMAIIITLAIMITSMPINVNAEDTQTKISSGEYLIINSKSNKMAYYKNGKLIKEFKVATGKSSTPTPTGKFKIVNKIKNRPYYSGGIPGGSPKNPLGDRWIGLKVGLTNGSTYAVHGNNNESSIGKNISGGCVRMHNSDIRWLYDQIGIGGYALIDNSSKSFIEIAAKHGVDLSDEDQITQNIKNTQLAFKNFTNYSNDINLTNKNSIITTSSDARAILDSRQSYLDVYNKLNATEKKHSEIQKINAEYNQIIRMLEFAEASTRFYENISINAEYIKSDLDWVGRLNSHDGDEFGTRGMALKAYNNVVAYGENKDNSQRIDYLDGIYSDSVFFLNFCEYIGYKDMTNAKDMVNKIDDTNLKNIASLELEKYTSDIEGHWAESSITEAMNNGWVDTSNNFRPNSFITRAEFIKIVNRAFNFVEVSEIDFNDVNENSWYYEEVKKAVNAGYIAGCGDNMFNPEGIITREEVAVIITSIKNNKEESLEHIYYYQDANLISDWASSSVEGAIRNGYMGVSDTHFRPKDSINRAESVVALQRIK